MDFAGTIRSHNCLAKLRRQNVLVDIDIYTSSCSVGAHRIILASHSGFFDAKLRPDWQGQTASVDLRHMSHATVLTLIEAIYTCELNIAEENALDLLSAASELDIRSVADACSQVRPFKASLLSPFSASGHTNPE